MIDKTKVLDYSDDTVTEVVTKMRNALEKWYLDGWPNGWDYPIADSTLVLDGVCPKIYPNDKSYDRAFQMGVFCQYNKIHIIGNPIIHQISEMILASVKQNPAIKCILFLKSTRLAEKTAIASRIPYVCVPLIYSMQMYFLESMGVRGIIRDNDEIGVRDSKFIAANVETETIVVNLDYIRSVDGINNAAWVMQIILAFTEYLAELVGFNRVDMINAHRFFEKDTHWLRRYILENRRQLDIVVW